MRAFIFILSGDIKLDSSFVVLETKHKYKEECVCVEQ